MKKILLFLGIILSNYSYSQTVLLEESFDDITTLTDWTISNQSTEPYNDWIQGSSEIFDAYEGTSFIAANYLTSLFDNISMWLISPVLNLKDGDIVTFYTRNPGDGYADRLQFRLSSEENFVEPVGETDLGSFTNLLLDINPNLEDFGYPTEWTLQSIEISGIGNTPVPVNLAFRYFVEDAGYFGNYGDYIGIDALKIEREDTQVGCLGASWGQYPISTVNTTCNGRETSLTGGLGWFGEYSQISVTEGTIYKFRTDVETAFITIGNAAGDTVIATGTGLVEWEADFSGEVRFYTHENDQCLETMNFVDRLVTCGELPEDPTNCEENAVASEGFTNGLFFDGQKNAADIFTGENGYTITGLNLNVFVSSPDDNTFKINVLNDADGLPGDVFATSETEIIASALEGSNFGFDVYSFSLKFDEAIVLDANKKYWIEVESNSLAWETTTSDYYGSNLAFANIDTSSNWVISTVNVDFVYELICEDLGITELDSYKFTYYPNPVNDILTIQSKIEVKSIEIFNVAGQKVNFKNSLKAGQLDMSSLTSGVYVVRAVLENNQVETFKVIKK